VDCEYFGRCGSCTSNLPYLTQIDEKLSFIKSKFRDFYSGEFEFFTSNPRNYRSRAEFGIWHEGEDFFYTMHGIDEKRVFIDNCAKVDEKIAQFMGILREYLNSHATLKQRLFGAEFIATKCDFMAILLYHKNVCEIENDLQKMAGDLKIKLIARSRGKKLIFGSENLDEILEIKGQKFRYTFGDNAFIQPNREVNEKMISWAFENIFEAKDLFELYCGHGNFTVPLSLKFGRVLANEINKSSIKNAHKNCELNGISNINFVRMSSEEIISAFRGEQFQRLSEIRLDEFEFSHILVDPPRAGLDESVCDFITHYPNIIYISCNPATLHKNLHKIIQTHEIVKFAVFDQFPHTAHIESGVLLRKKK